MWTHQVCGDTTIKDNCGYQKNLSILGAQEVFNLIWK